MCLPPIIIAVIEEERINRIKPFFDYEDNFERYPVDSLNTLRNRYGLDLNTIDYFTSFIPYTISRDVLKAIADFQSADDKRIQEVYAKLIAMYQAAEAEKNAAALNPSAPITRERRNILANLYAQFGYKDLYEIATVVAEIKRVKQENIDIMSSVDQIK